MNIHVSELRMSKKDLMRGFHQMSVFPSDLGSPTGNKMCVLSSQHASLFVFKNKYKET